MLYHDAFCAALRRPSATILHLFLNGCQFTLSGACFVLENNTSCIRVLGTTPSVEIDYVSRASNSEVDALPEIVPPIKCTSDPGPTRPLLSRPMPLSYRLVLISNPELVSCCLSAAR